MSQAKCLIVTTHYRPLIGGALTVYDALAVRAGGSISVLTASTDYVSGEEVEGWQAFDRSAAYVIDRLPHMRIGMLKPGVGLFGKLKARFSAWRLSRRILAKTIEVIKRDGIDVVCIGAQDALGWMIEPLKRKTNVKVIIYVHGEEVSQAAYSLKAEQRRAAVLHAADSLVAVSSFTVGILKDKYGVPAERIYLQTNGVDLDQFSGNVPEGARDAEGLPDGRFIFACGRLVDRKGFDMLIEAWPAVVEAVPGVKLVIGGKGPLEDSLKKRITELGIDDSVEMLGWVTDSQLVAAYTEADIFTMPNRTMPDGDTEGFGLVFLEAAAMGSTSVGGRAGGAVDAIIDGETGLFVDGYQVSEISAALIKLLQDEALRAELASNAKAHALTQGWQQKTDDFLKYLNSLATGYQ